MRRQCGAEGPVRGVDNSLSKDERRFTGDERCALHQHCAGRSFNEFDFVPIGSIDEEKPAAGGGLRRPVGDRHLFRLQTPDRVVQIFDFKGQVDEIFLNPDRSARGETAEFDELLAIGHLEEGQVGSARRDFPFQDLQPQDVPVETDGLLHVADPQAGVEEFGDFHTGSL